MWKVIEKSGILTLLTVQQPVERLNPRGEGLSGWEFILYIMALAFSFQGTFLPRCS
jgi:hypothetical protein